MDQLLVTSRIDGVKGWIFYKYQYIICIEKPVSRQSRKNEQAVNPENCVFINPAITQR